ncbi:MAG: monovalent cation/H(+) antiporter subunit G [Acetatifactor sp.]
MAVWEWIRFVAGAVFLLIGLGIFVIEMIGVFRFRYALNRMHAAAMGDTLGIGSCLLGLIILCGWNFTSLKLFLIILFLWLSSPTSSHLIARLEVATDEEPEKHYRRIVMEDEQAAELGTELGTKPGIKEGE